MLARRAILGGAAGLLAVPAFAQQAALRPLTPPPPLGPVPPEFVPMRTGRGRPGRWEVVADKTAQEGRAVTQLDADPTDERYPLLVYQGATAVDIAAAVRFRAISGKGDQAGGLAVRVTGADRYVLVRANALENNVRLYRVVGGVRQQIAGVDVPVAADTWHTLVLAAQGEVMSVGFNGQTLFRARDRQPTTSGRVALWTKADSVTAFEALTIAVL